MAEQKITLPTLELDLQKVTTFVSRPFRLTQGDKGYIQPFHLSVGFAPYSATADTLCFAGTKPDGQIIEVEAEPSRFSKDGDTWFFSLPDEVAQAIGTFEAYFYVKKGNSVVASTTKFAYEVGAKFGDDEASNSYVSVFNSLRDKFNQIIESSRTELNNWTSLNNQARADLDKLLNDLKTQTDNWLSAKSSEIQGIITNYNNKYNELVGKWNNQITTQQNDYTAQKAKIDSEYKQQLENLKSQLNSEWQTQKQAQQTSFDSFKADLTNRISQAKSDINSIQTKTTELQAKLDEINSKVRDVDFNSFVKSVQGVKPDANGNINLPNQNVAFSFNSSTGEPTMRMTPYLNYWPVDQAAIKDVLKNQLPNKYFQVQDLPANTNVDNLSQTGLYNLRGQAGITGLPQSGNLWGTLLVFNNNNSSNGIQMYLNSNDDYFFYREWNKSSGYVERRPWKRLASMTDVQPLWDKLNLSGNLSRYLNSDSTWADIFGNNDTNYGHLTAFKVNGGSEQPNVLGRDSSGIAFGNGDTRGTLAVNWLDHQARISGGNGNGPRWHEDIAWKSDFSNYYNKSETDTKTRNLQAQVSTLQNRCEALETNLAILQSKINNLLTLVAVSDDTVSIQGNLEIHGGQIRNYWGGVDQYVAYSPSGVKRGYFGVWDNGTFQARSNS